VETLLLALSRGAGLAGLSAMPARWLRDGVDYARPLLEVSAADIRSWLHTQGLPWIEDPSNAHTDFLRNRLRAELMPVLRAIIPHYAETLPRSAAHAAQAQEGGHRKEEGNQQIPEQIRVEHGRGPWVGA
jgi:tRNA(Ile)-lysidine synthase